MPNQPYVTLARGVYSAQEQLRATRQAVAENSARLAFHQAKFHVTGAGYLAMNRAVMFDCVFVDPPTLAMGIVVTKFPGGHLLRYPMCNVGAWKWVTEQSPAGKSAIKVAQDNLNLLLAAKAADEFVSSTDIAKARAALDAAKKDESTLLWKGAYPYFHVDLQPVLRDDPLPTNVGLQITFDLIWVGVAYKDLGNNIMDDLFSDPAATPLTTISDSLI